MINLSNDQALQQLRQHEEFAQFLKRFDQSQYPGVSLEQAYLFISTGVMVEGMNLRSSIRLINDIKQWVSKHSHGGLRSNAGRKKSEISYKKITLTADENDIDQARKRALELKISLQSAFRKWLRDFAR